MKPEWVENNILLSELFRLIKTHQLNIIFFQKAFLKNDFWKEFYMDHVGANYFEEMIQWMSSSPSIFFIVDGDKAVDLVRWQIIGRNGSGLRGKYQVSELKNVAHASDSEKSAIREIQLVYRLLK